MSPVWGRECVKYISVEIFILGFYSDMNSNICCFLWGDTVVFGRQNVAHNVQRRWIWWATDETDNSNPSSLDPTKFLLLNDFQYLAADWYFKEIFYHCDVTSYEILNEWLTFLLVGVRQSMDRGVLQSISVHVCGTWIFSIYHISKCKIYHDILCHIIAYILAPQW